MAKKIKWSCLKCDKHFETEFYFHKTLGFRASLICPECVLEEVSITYIHPLLKEKYVVNEKKKRSNKENQRLKEKSKTLQRI